LFFRNWPTDTKQAKEFARQTISRFGKRSAEILYSNSEYGVNAKKLFRDAYEALAGKVPVEESYEPNATDFRPQIRKFQQTPAECVWLFGYYSEVGRFLKQARELGLRTQFFGQEGIEGNDLLTVAGPASEGLIYFVPSFDPESPSDQVKKFSAAFRARTGHEPDVFAAHAYDALRILVGAIHTVGADPQKVARYLPSVKNYQGVAGLTSIDENGDAIKPLMVKTVANGRFVRFH
jgi:branched-chain amino acid transport system substrate-binding protein